MLKPFVWRRARPVGFLLGGCAAVVALWLVGLGPFALLVHFSESPEALPLFSILRICLTVVIGAISGLTAFSIWLLVRTIQELVHD